MKPVAAKLEITSEQEATLYLNKPEYGISAGQAAVCYLDDIVLGGGWIHSSERSKMALAS
jgi:tRNA-specific 2-thiouridylase